MFAYATPRNEDYDANIRGAVASAKGRLVSQKSVHQSGVTGREIVIEDPHSVVVRERLFWIAGRLYWVVFSSAQPGASTAPAVGKFLDSFECSAAAIPGLLKARVWAHTGGDANRAHIDDFEHWTLCMGGGGTATALKACSAIIDAGHELPDSLPYAYLYRGKAQLALNHNDQAFQDFTAALKFDPPLAHAQFGLGQVYKARADWPHAAEEFGEAAASQSEDADIDAFTADAEGTFRPDSLTEHGYALYKSGDLQSALADFDQASKLCPTCSGPYRDKALVLDALQKNDEALAAADRAIALNPRSGAAFLVRGVIKAHAAKYDQAIADYDEALRLDPSLDIARKARDSAVKRGGSAGENEIAGVAAKALAAPTLDDAALTNLFTAKVWKARQGPWLATLEFRGDGTFRQRSKDTSKSSTLEVTWDGIWGVSQGKLCIDTNVIMCLAAHQAGGDIVLARTDQSADEGAVEYFGPAAALRDFSADAVSDPIEEFPIEEVLLPAPAGVAKGPKTLFYYIHGFDGHARNHSPLPEYFVSEIQNSRGWDVIEGNYPRSGVDEIRRAGGSNFGSAVFLARRLKELKAQGYQRIYVGGQSWGGWTSLDLATIPGLPIDGVVLVVPACGGWRSTGADRSDPSFANNKIFFDQLIARVRYPTAAVFFLGDEYEPADRGIGAAATLTKHGVPNLIIDHPPAFSGHGSAWFPAFDYLYGGCIADFLEAPKTRRCPGRKVSLFPTEFRSVVTEAQLAGRIMKMPTLADLTGRQFAVYPTGDLHKVVSADKTEVKGFGIGDSVVTSAFRNGLYCVRGRVKYNQPESTEEVCSQLVEWSSDAILALDPQNGKVLQWWVSHP
jgi:tetratricopeptide (TPR) repeat protein/pimeloyl-ACP methyl ester carboxylesterase